MWKKFRITNVCFFWVQSFTDHDEPCLFVGPSTLFGRKIYFTLEWFYGADLFFFFNLW